jgi:hypothetical protein
VIKPLFLYPIIISRHRQVLRCGPACRAACLEPAPLGIQARAAAGQCARPGPRALRRSARGAAAGPMLAAGGPSAGWLTAHPAGLPGQAPIFTLGCVW